MDRRRFGRTSILTLLFGGLAGCGNETRETGTVVQTPPEDLKSMEASAAAYRAMGRKKSPAPKK